MHLSDERIRSYIEGDISLPVSDHEREHLRMCTKCQERARVLANQAQNTRARLDALVFQPDQRTTPAPLAFSRFEDRYLNKEKHSMFQKILTRAYRPAWITIGVLLILATALLFPPVQAIANSFLGLFRVEKLTVVQIDAGNLPERLGASDTFQALFSENAQIEPVGEFTRAETPAEASQLAGIPIRLPTGLEGEPRLEVQPGGKMSFQVDLALINELLKEIDREDVRFPPEIDGAQVSIEIPAAVVSSYGDCGFAEDQAVDPDAIAYTPSGCINLIQVASPTINAPPGLDLAQIGSALLQVVGMSPEDADALSRQIDWTTTLVLPIPRYEAAIEQVIVDGVDGTFIRQAHSPQEPFYMLVWVKNGIIYALAGSGDKEEALSIAASLK